MEIQGVIGADKVRGFVPGTDFSMAVMGAEGDIKTIWNKNNTEEVENARETFDKMKKKGFIAYKVTGEGGKGEVLHEFDPNVEKMILIPQMQGG